MSNYLGIDPSTKSYAWALLSNDEWTAGKIDGYWWVDVAEQLLDCPQGTAVMVEGQYMCRNAKVFGMLSAVRGGIEAQAEIVGHEVYEAVAPFVWQRLLEDYVPHGHKKHTRMQRRQELKAASVVRAEEISGLHLGSDNDIADAVNIADYLRLAMEVDDE